MNYQFDYEPPCGNGIDEELFDRVTDILSKNCDSKEDDYLLYSNDEIKVLDDDMYNIPRYNLGNVKEGFSIKRTGNDSMENYTFWILVLILIAFIAYVVYYNNSKK